MKNGLLSFLPLALLNFAAFVQPRTLAGQSRRYSIGPDEH